MATAPNLLLPPPTDSDNFTQVHDHPRILVNEKLYGAVQPSDIHAFLGQYNKWPDSNRALIEGKDVAFVMGAELPKLQLTHEGTTKLIPIAASEVNGVAVRRDRAQGRKERWVPLKHESDLKLGVIHQLLGDGPAAIDWKAVKFDFKKAAPLGDTTEWPDSPLTLMLLTKLFAIQWGDDAIAPGYPNATKATKQYEAFIEQEYVKLKQEQKNKIAQKRTAQYQPDDRAFTLNRESDGLTAPQIAYFEKLNDTLQLLGATPKEFDSQFRVTSTQLIRLLANRAHDHGSNFMYGMMKGGRTAKDLENLDQRSEAYEEHYDPLAKIPRITFGGKPILRKDHLEESEPYTKGFLHFADRFLGLRNIDFSFGLTENDKSALRQIPPYYEGLAVGIYNEDVIDYTGFTEKQRLGFMQMREQNKTNTMFDSAFVTPISAQDNVIHQYGAANLSISELAGKVYEVKTRAGMNIRLPDMAAVFEAAMYSNVIRIAKLKQLPENQQAELVTSVTQKLEEMAALWPLAKLSQQKYRAFCDNENAKIENDKYRKDLADKQEAERLARETAEADRKARLPQAYEFKSLIFARIAREAGKSVDMHPSLTVDKRKLYINMAALHKVLKPFTDVRNFDLKIPPPTRPLPRRCSTTARSGASNIRSSPAAYNRTSTRRRKSSLPPICARSTPSTNPRLTLPRHSSPPTKSSKPCSKPLRR